MGISLYWMKEMLCFSKRKYFWAEILAVAIDGHSNNKDLCNMFKQ